MLVTETQNYKATLVTKKYLDCKTPFSEYKKIRKHKSYLENIAIEIDSDFSYLKRFIFPNL